MSTVPSLGTECKYVVCTRDVIDSHLCLRLEDEQDLHTLKNNGLQYTCTWCVGFTRVALLGSRPTSAFLGAWVDRWDLTSRRGWYGQLCPTDSPSVSAACVGRSQLFSYKLEPTWHVQFARGTVEGSIFMICA